MPWALRLAPANATDLFVAYERLSRAYGGDRVVAYVAHDVDAQLSQFPLLALDVGAFRDVGPFDEGFQYVGGVASWLDRANAIEPADWVDFIVDPFPQASSSDEARGTSTWLATAPPSEADESRLKQLDADAFYLDRPGSFSFPWMTRRLTPLSARRRATSSDYAVAAMICVYDDVRFVAPLLEDLLPRVHTILILQSTKPWYGRPRPSSLDVAAEHLATRLARDPKVSLVRGSWPSEEDQRNFGMHLATTLPESPTHVLLVDGDEFWHPVELDRALALVAEREAAGAPVGWARATMATYWKSTRTVVSPPEPLRILWLVATSRHNATALSCSFSEARNWACSGDGLNPESLSAQMDAQGVFLDPSTALCHHLSYVRTTAELHDKVTSFAHARDVQRGWMDSIWHRWDRERNLTNLHPTHPTAFAATRNQPLWALPPALRRLSIRAEKESRDCESDGAPRLYCRLIQTDAADSLDLGQAPEVDVAHIRSRCGPSTRALRRAGRVVTGFVDVGETTPRPPSTRRRGPDTRSSTGRCWLTNTTSATCQSSDLPNQRHTSSTRTHTCRAARWVGVHDSSC